MNNLRITEIKAFVPSKDFALSKQFYKDLGLRPWKMRDFCLSDPTGVLWRIGQNTD
jgi:hypothetical protein